MRLEVFCYFHSVSSGVLCFMSYNICQCVLVRVKDRYRVNMRPENRENVSEYTRERTLGSVRDSQ